MRGSGPRAHAELKRNHLLVLLLVFLLGAGFIWYSLDTHPVSRSRVDVINTRKPMNVLVGVQGTPLDPGFVGFVAEVRPDTRVLKVVPISGRTPVTMHHRHEPLYQAVSATSAQKATQLVSHASGIAIDHYFYLNRNDLLDVTNALYYHSPHWPKKRTPLTMLKILGYPNGRIQPQQEMKLVREMVNHLPTISPIAAGSLISIPRTALTNLTDYQLFLLANYVRGDQLRQGFVRHHHTVGTSHG